MHMYIHAAILINIVLFLLDADAAPVCNFNSQLRSANVRASYVQLQPATGCAVNNSQNDEKKYVKFYLIEEKCMFIKSVPYILFLNVI